MSCVCHGVDSLFAQWHTRCMSIPPGGMHVKEACPLVKQHPQDIEVIHSLSRIEGHVRAVKKMAEDGEPCAAILHQISAVRAAMKKVAQTVILNHVDHYVNQPDLDAETLEMLADIKDALGSYLRRPI